MELGPRKTDARPAPYAVLYQGESPAMPEMEPKAPKFGLQVQADINPRYALVLGASTAVLDSQSRDIRSFFVGFYIDSPRETRISLSVNQFWLGGRRYFPLPWEKGSSSPASASDSSSRPSPRFYGEMGVVGLTEVNLTTDVWLHVYAPEEGFDFYKVASSAARGSGYMTYFGVGGEYYFKRWLSIETDFHYVIGGVTDIRYTRFFTADPLEEGIIKPGDVVAVTDLSRGRRETLYLDLEGLDFNAMLKFYF
ncbi:MAG: hypothetical protein HY760_02240 [Nitrospirae bacterium]|nr:hypothetical protein [Nitrospirota bacterium]